MLTLQSIQNFNPTDSNNQMYNVTLYSNSMPNHTSSQKMQFCSKSYYVLWMNLLAFKQVKQCCFMNIPNKYAQLVGV